MLRRVALPDVVQPSRTAGFQALPGQVAFIPRKRRCDHRRRTTGHEVAVGLGRGTWTGLPFRPANVPRFSEEQRLDQPGVRARLRPRRGQVGEFQQLVRQMDRHEP